MKPPEAKYIWTDTTGAGRNRYVLFRRSFELTAAAQAGTLHIFADTRYRLMVNGVVLGHGPARFFVESPEYDTHDISPFLRDGANVIAVVVNGYGCVTFHTEKSVGGLVAWGRVTDGAGAETSLATDASWKALESPGHQRETGYLSFALNPGEVLDARQLPPGWDLPDFDDSDWSQGVEMEAQDHWGELRPRSIPLLDEREVLARRRLGAWVAAQAEDEDVYSFVLPGRSGAWRLQGAPAMAFTYLHSPCDQEVTLYAWWGKYWINGEELGHVERHDMPLRHDLNARLREGWNTFVVMERVSFDSWTFYLGLPRAAGLTVSAEKEDGSPHTFLLAGPWEGETAERAAQLELPLASPEELPQELGGWQPWPRVKAANSAWFERARKKFTKLPDDASIEVAGRSFSSLVRDDVLVLLYDFGTEVLGRPALTFTAAAGTVVDLTYCEKLRDGLPHLYPRPEVRMAERYVARQGEQVWQTFHPRGFRYLEVLVQGGLDAFELRKVAVTRANYAVRNAGSFECPDPVLNQVWKLGRATQHACMEDAYLDCPWRERGLYAGDFLVQFYTNLAAYGDRKLMRRCIELFFLSQDESGMLAPCPHGLEPGRHPDYSAITVQALWHYYARSGDLDFLREMAPRLADLMTALEGFERPDIGLLDGSSLHPYIDLCRMDREGVSCALNCFHQRAFSDAARIMEAVGDGRSAGAYGRKAEALARSIRGEFWDGERGAFVDRLKADVPSTEPSVPANALPLLYDIAGEDQVPGALRYLTEAMLNNFRVPEPESNTDCNVTSYFSFYALGVLYRFGKVREAEQFIRTYWGRMLDRGAWTCWEYFIDRASQCHAWSSCPTHYLSTEVLGVAFPEPGNLHLVRIAPHPGTLTWAAGTYPHPDGPISVEWQVKDGRLLLHYDAPEGVQVVTDSEL